METNFRKTYREKRKEKEQQQKEKSRMNNPVKTEDNMVPKTTVSASGKTAPQQHLAGQPTNMPEMTSSPLDLLRAKDALSKIDDLKAKSLKGIGYGNYVSYLEGLPAAILQNGLGQALATLLAGAKLADPPDKRKDDEKAREKLYQQINGWLCRGDADAPYPGKDDLMHAIVHGDEDSYLRGQAETLAYLRWLKKFAVAFLKKKENG